MKSSPTHDFEEWELDFLSQTSEIEITPTDAEKWLIRGHIFNDHKNTEEALISYRKAIDSDHNCVAAYESIVATLEKEGEFEKSIEVAIEAIHKKHGILHEVNLDKYKKPLVDRLLSAFEEHHKKAQPVDGYQ